MLSGVEHEISLSPRGQLIHTDGGEDTVRIQSNSRVYEKRKFLRKKITYGQI